MGAIHQVLMMGGGAADSTSAVVNNATYFRASGSPAGVKFLSDGTVQYKGPASTYTYTYTWRTGSTDSSKYEIMATLVDGLGVSLGTLDTWQALTSDRTWERSTTSGTLKECTIEVSIRDATSHAILDTGEIYLWAELP